MTEHGNAPSRKRTSRLGRILRLARKELRETLRDRRTVITLLLMPVLVYPLLSISFNKSLMLTADQTREPTFTIGVNTEDDLALLQQLLSRGQQILDGQVQATRGNDSDSQQASSAAGLAGDAIKLVLLETPDLEKSVAGIDVHVAVALERVEPDRPPKRQRRGMLLPIHCELIYRSDSPSSERVMRFVEDRLQAVNQDVLQLRLAELRGNSDLPTHLAYRPVKPAAGVPFSLATLVPLVLILMTITGSVYPAIDLTAGERERGTMEMLIAAPVSRLSLLIAKYTAVLVVAILTALVNLLAMIVTLLTSSLGRQLFPDGVSPWLMLQIFGLMVLFAAFFSAIVLAVTSFARSFKEAQAYLIPLMLLAISPGLLSLMPGIKLTGIMAVAPLVNIVLLSRDMLEGTADPKGVFLAIMSTAIYAVLAIAVASRIFGNDALLYASRGSWSELFQRPKSSMRAATPAAGLACLATLFPCYYVLGNLAQVPDATMTTRLLLNAAVTVLVFGLWPLLFALVQRVSLWTGFRIAPASWLAFAAAVVLGLALWPFAFELYLVGQWANLVSIEKNQYTMAQQLIKSFQGISPWLLIGSLAVVPATMEELFFRGYLFTSLKNRFQGPVLITITALLFGLFHVLSPQALMPERFLPSTMLGFVLGWVCYRTGSILPGILLHAVHNAFLLLMVRHQDWLVQRGWNVEQSAHVPVVWLIGFGMLAVIAAAMMHWVTAGRDSRADAGETSAATDE